MFFTTFPQLWLSSLLQRACVFMQVHLSERSCVLGFHMAVDSQEHLNPHFALACVLQLLSARLCTRVHTSVLWGGPSPS